MTATTTNKIVQINTSVLAHSELSECEALVVKEDEDCEQEDFDRWSAHIIEILKANKDLLKTFIWASRHGDDFGLPMALYQALGSLKNLEKLHLSVVSSDYDNWVALLEGSGLTKLQSLQLKLDSAHGWDCAPLERFLATLPNLKDLALSFPACCGPHNIPLSTTFPNLKSLSLKTFLCSPSTLRSRLSQDILRRHPQLESLHLDTDYDFALGPQDLPNLKFLGITESTLREHPDFHSTTRPVEKLHLNMFWGNTIIEEMVNLTRETLKILELEYLSIEGFRKQVQEVDEQFSPLFKNLEELSIIATAANTSPEPPQFTENDIAAVLNSTRTTNIKTLHFRDAWRSGAILSPAFLEDVGVPVSPSLERIVWNPDGTARVYNVNRTQDGGRVSLVQSGTLASAEDLV